MTTPPIPSPVDLHCEHIDRDELDGARRLLRSVEHRLDLSPSTVAHHLDVLESAGLVHRVPWTLYDRRRVAVRLTPTGRYAARRLTGAAPSARTPSGSAEPGL